MVLREKSTAHGFGKVTLRLASADDLDEIRDSLSSTTGTGEFQWFGFTPAMKLRARFAENGLIGPDDGMLTVCLDGRSIGRVEWFASSWGRPATSGCWTIAAGIHEDHRGSGLGSEAQRLLVEYLFKHFVRNRIQAYTDVENIAERKALERVGFSLEGVLRAAQWRDGSFHDMALYSILRTDIGADHE